MCCVSLTTPTSVRRVGRVSVATVSACGLEVQSCKAATASNRKAAPIILSNTFGRCAAPGSGSIFPLSAQELSTRLRVRKRPCAAAHEASGFASASVLATLSRPLPLPPKAYECYEDRRNIYLVMDICTGLADRPVARLGGTGRRLFHAAV